MVALKILRIVQVYEIIQIMLIFRGLYQNKKMPPCGTKKRKKRFFSMCVIGSQQTSQIICG